MNKLIFIPLLFIIGCSTLSSTVTNQPNSKGNYSMTGMRLVGDILERKLINNEVVDLSVSVNSKIDPNYKKENYDNSDLTNAQEILMISELKKNLSKYAKFSIIDTSGLEDLSKANYLLAVSVNASDYTQWAGKLIELPTRKTIGEFVCVMSNDPTDTKDPLCN